MSNLNKSIFLIMLIFIYLLIPLTVNANTNMTFDAQKVDNYIEQNMKQANIPGLSIGIVKGDKVIHLKGFGKSNDNRVAVIPQTPFILGSVSKSITALAVMQLVEKGKIELDAPVKRYIPWFELADKNSSSKITIRNLLNHTSGLSRFNSLKYITDSDLNSLEQYIHKLKYVHPSKPVGREYQYANENYQLLGLVVENVSGVSYEEYIKQNIFNPLNMQNSFTEKSEALQKGLATGYRVLFGFPFSCDLKYPRAYLPSGYIISSAEDMSNFLIAQINNGSYGNTSLISASGIIKMHKPAVQAKSINSNTYYGMGWITTSIDDINVLCHSGDLENYCSNIIIVPEEKLGIIVLSNVDNQIISNNPVTEIAIGVVKILCAEKPPEKIHTYWHSYLIINFSLLIIIIIVFTHIITLSGWLKKVKNVCRFSYFRILSMASLYIFLPLFILLGIPKVIGIPWMFVLGYGPDIGYFILTISGLFLILGIFKIATYLFYIFCKKIKNEEYSE